MRTSNFTLWSLALYVLVFISLIELKADTRLGIARQNPITATHAQVASPIMLTGGLDYLGNMNLTWQASPDATSYSIDRLNIATGVWTSSIGTTTVTNYQDTSTSRGSGSYLYRVIAKTPQSDSSSPSNTFPISCYAIIDLGSDPMPMKITNSGLVLNKTSTGYSCFDNGSFFTFGINHSGDAFEANDITEDGMVVGEETTDDGSSGHPVRTGIETWTLPSSGSVMDAGTPDYDAGNGGAGSGGTLIGGIFPEWYYGDGQFIDNGLRGTGDSNRTMARGDHIDAAHNIWSNRFIDTFYPYGGPVAYFDEYKGTTRLGDVSVTVDDYDLIGVQVETLAVSATGKALLESDTYLGDDNEPTVSYKMDDGSSHALAFHPAGINDAGVVVGVNTDGTEGIWWDASSGAHNLGAGFFPTAINAATAQSNFIYQIMGNGFLWEMNPTTSLSSATFKPPLSISDLVFPESGWSNINGNSINNSGMIAGTATYTHIDGSDTNPAGQHGVLLVKIGLNCSKADTSSFPLNSGISPNINPAYFFKATPLDPTLSQSQEPALVVFYKDAINSSFVIQNFTVNLSVGPGQPGVTWTQIKGADLSGTLQNDTRAEAQYVNPNVGGLYQFDATIDTKTVRTSLILPLAGAEMQDIVSDDMAKADAFAAKVVAKYSLYERNSKPLNYAFFWINGNGDYRGRPDVPLTSSKTCARFNSVNDSSGFGAVVTWFGVPVRLAKLSDFLVGYAQYKIGVTSFAAWYGRGAGTHDDASGAASYQLGWDIARGAKHYSTDTVAMLKANFYNSDVKNTRLWPNDGTPTNQVSNSSISNYNTQFSSPGLTEMTDPTY